MLTTNEELPEDLVIQILLWLPVMSLLRLKCVCKSWCDLISGQNFITKHLLHNQTTSNKNMNVGFLLLRREKTSHNYVFSKLPYETLEISSTQAVPSSCLGTNKTDKFDIVGLSNGIHEVGSRTESVKVNHKAQVMAHGPAVVLNIMNPRDTVIEQLMDEAVNLDAPEVTHIVGKRIKGVINVSLSTPQFSGNHNTENQGADFSAKEFDARINEIDSEMGKFDHINCMTQPSNISQDILGEAREKQVLAKP
ncbi:putative f-box protein [Quercus suber]|uniref:F-box protein n=1 Tax=Quercus suber TaxID=58331 RepID=A0AAW0LHK1_QUESU